MRALTGTRLIPVLLSVGITCCSKKLESPTVPDMTAKQDDIEIGGRKVVTLSHRHSMDPSQPQILGADILPGRGMNIYQIHAYIPGKGEVGLLVAPPLEEAKGLMNGGAGDACAFRESHPRQVGSRRQDHCHDD
jgi:hypothetical protein